MNPPELPDRMRAARLTSWGSPPELVEVDRPVPTGSQVLLRVDAAGLCQSDLHVMDALPGQLPYEPPFTLGHEVAGTVAAVGDGVDPRRLGDRVVVHGVWGCGDCRNCVRGRESYCLRLPGGPVGCGLGLDGGLAEYVLVPEERFLVDSPSLPAIEAAPLTDAGLTAFHAVDRHLRLAEGGTVLLIGVGGLGHLALQMLRAQSVALVVAVDTRPAARDLALRLGAHAVADSVAAGAERLAGLGRGPGVDLVIDFVGAPSTTSAVPAVLAPGGRVVVVGSGGGSLEAAKGRTLPNGWSFTAPFWGHRADLEAVVGLAEAGTISSSTRTYPLERVGQAFDDLRSGRIDGRAVVVPHDPQAGRSAGPA
ncbi:NAD(P)-dependent alcohol dehydrogenase [Nocardioides zeae]|uniref:alcohol dehydrogenase n=1 Tax=Nocardioides imazamoxiresistens TaxID=3231893 RepID=A0ABU3PVP8_9ACTN|nr:NAD(P)-dependent alcohol dehydrogenase [Nocardioides zeae]MDT9593269.1 NAD(P)-dependent alcohol dehydrogenase [Nocardioides zeae]